MNTNSRKRDARSQTEGSGLNNPQGVTVTGRQAQEALQKLAPFFNRQQWHTLWDLCKNSEEKAYFRQMVRDLWARIAGMHGIYGQAGKGAEAIAYLHYFSAGFDWYITEKDIGDGTAQAFGLTVWAIERELGYISIRELVAGSVELDLYWTPKTLAEIRR